MDFHNKLFPKEIFCFFTSYSMALMKKMWKTIFDKKGHNCIKSYFCARVFFCQSKKVP